MPPPTLNKILNKVNIGKVKKDGQEILVSIATNTEAFRRTEEFARQMGPRLLGVLQNDIGKVAPGTKECIVRDTEHPSDADPIDHVTAVQLPETAPDDEIPTNGKSAHFYPKM